MIGIYCITNKITGEQYVGQSINIEERKHQHFYNYQCDSKESNKVLYKAMRKYGVNNFIFSILEECLPEELNNKETFWIDNLDTYYHGYNMNRGGDNFSIGENNSNTKLTDKDVLIIRKRVHLGNEYPKDVYEDYKTLIGYDRFWSLLHGDTWKNVDMSMIKPIKQDNSGSKNPRSKLTEKDVEEIRKRKYILKESISFIYQDYKDKVKFSTFEKAVYGQTWKNVPMPELLEPVSTIPEA